MIEWYQLGSGRSRHGNKNRRVCFHPARLEEGNCFTQGHPRTRRQTPGQADVELLHEVANLRCGDLAPTHRELRQQRSQDGAVSIGHNLVKLGGLAAAW